MFSGIIEKKNAFRSCLTLPLTFISPGGYLCWNIADGYEGFNAFFLDYDKIINEHVAKGEWSFVQPAKKQENMLFEDAGYTYVMKKH